MEGKRKTRQWVSRLRWTEGPRSRAPIERRKCLREKLRSTQKPFRLRALFLPTTSLPAPEITPPPYYPLFPCRRLLPRVIRPSSRNRASLMNATHVTTAPQTGTNLDLDPEQRYQSKRQSSMKPSSAPHHCSLNRLGQLCLLSLHPQLLYPYSGSGT